jgi:hypothetical protein
METKMTDTTEVRVSSVQFDAARLVKAYIKMRDAKAEITRKAEEEVSAIQEEMDLVEHALLDICKQTGQDGGKTAAGTFTRSVKTRYTTANWPAMYKFIKDQDAPELLEQRIHQTNMKSFLQENPNLLPEGLNVDSRYSVTVRRASK